MLARYAHLSEGRSAHLLSKKLNVCGLISWQSPYRGVYIGVSRLPPPKWRGLGRATCSRPRSCVGIRGKS